MYPRYLIPISLVKNPSAVYLRSVEKNSIPGLSLGSFLCVLVERDEIQHFCPLPRSTLQVGLPVPLDAGRVKPHEPTPKLKLEVLILATKQIKEFGRARFYRASTFLVGRNDRLTQVSQCFVLMLVEKFGRVLS
jgi:hypothetical protein